MDMVERVARAMWEERRRFSLEGAGIALERFDEPWGDIGAAEANNIYGEARAAIAALKLTDPVEGVPGGIAFEDAFFGEQATVFHALRDAWNTTIDAALAIPSPQQQEMK